MCIKWDDEFSIESEGEESEEEPNEQQSEASETEEELNSNRL